MLSWRLPTLDGCLVFWPKKIKQNSKNKDVKQQRTEAGTRSGTGAGTGESTGASTGACGGKPREGGRDLGREGGPQGNRCFVCCHWFVWHQVGRFGGNSAAVLCLCVVGLAAILPLFCVCVL